MAITRSSISPLFSAIVISMLASCGGNQGESNDTAGGKALPTKLHEMSVANNVATYPGDRNDYKLTKSENGYAIEAVTNSTGIKILENVSSVQFANVTVNLGIEKKVKILSPQDLTSLIELYIAFFNRLPDADGLSYWIDRINAGQTLSDVAESFHAAGVQYTSVTGYSTTMTNDDFIKVIYKNVLDRSGTTAPSGADVQYWSNQLISGRATRGTLVRIMLNSAHSYKGDPGWGWVPALLDNKSAVGNYFAIQHGLSYNNPEASIRETMAIAAAVRPTDTDAAVAMIDSLIKPKPIAATTTVPVVTTTPVVPATTPSVTPTIPLVVATTPVAIPTAPVVTPTTPVAVPTVPAVTSTTPLITPTKPVVTAVTVPLCGIVASSTARVQTPMVMSTLNDEQFARLFFSEMNLSSPQFFDVRANLDKCNFPAALDAWKTAFIKMITTSSFLKSATGVILKAPGDVTALMANPIVYPAAGVPPDEQLINAVFANHRSDIPHTSFSDAQLIGRWGQFARRFANDPKSGAYWQRSPATLRDQIRSFFYTFINSIALSPDSFSTAIDARVTAEIAYYSLKWPIQNLHNARFINAPFPMNQRANALNTLQIALPYFPDFLDANAYRKSLDQDLPLLFGGSYYSPIGTDISVDGFGSELSYNYVYGVTTYALQDILNIAGTQSPQPAWLPEATKQKAKFEEMKRHLGTPGGVLIMGKNGRGETRMNVYSPANPPPAPGFLSEHFPYHGLSIMRQNWTRQSLFLALANPRRGSGHEAEDANKVHVEAYGQYMLVSNSGGDSIDLYFGSSWGQNTINVNNYGMVRTLEPRHAAYNTPVEGSWRSDANYDQVASTYRSGWGGKSATTGKMEFIKDTAFTRNVVYVKAANLWVAVDFLDGPATVVREYRQMWHFHSDYAKASVSSTVNASGIGVVASNQANIPNLAIYQLPLLGNISSSLRYDTYHGDGCTTSNDGGLAFLPTIAAGRGCMNMGTAYGVYSRDNRVLPAVDVHAKWSGSGPQAIVSILAPTPNQVPIVSSINRVATTSGSATYRVLLTSNKTIDIKLNTLINSEPVVTISGSGIVEAINVPRPPK